MTVKGIYDPKSPRFGFHAWGLETENLFNTLIQRLIKEGVELATEQYTAWASFAAEPWETEDNTEKKGYDATTITVRLPVGPTDCDEGRWSFTIKDMVKTIIDTKLDPNRAASPTDVEFFKRLAADFKVLAAQLDEIEPWKE